jgi:hypothetical protein
MTAIAQMETLASSMSPLGQVLHANARYGAWFPTRRVPTWKARRAGSRPAGLAGITVAMARRVATVAAQPGSPLARRAS